MLLTTEKPNRKGLNFNYYESEDMNHMIVRLYNTNIIIVDGEQIKLNTDGYRTNHTKNCINDFLPDGYNLYQKDFTWYVKTPNTTLDFYDNMVIEING